MLGRKEHRGKGSGPEMLGDFMCVREARKMRGDVDEGGARRDSGRRKG